MSQAKDIQFLARSYKNETGVSEIDVHEFGRWLIGNGWPLPAPASPEERLAKKIARALREEIRHDGVTGRPYRANHAYPVGGNQQGTLWAWIDIDEAPREPMRKSLQTRREQMVGDALQLTFDADHWNAMHPAEQPIGIELDFTDDVEWRKNAPEEQAS